MADIIDTLIYKRFASGAAAVSSLQKDWDELKDIIYATYRSLEAPLMVLDPIQQRVMSIWLSLAAGTQCMKKSQVGFNVEVFQAGDTGTFMELGALGNLARNIGSKANDIFASFIFYPVPQRKEYPDYLTKLRFAARAEVNGFLKALRDKQAGKRDCELVVLEHNVIEVFAGVAENMCGGLHPKIQKNSGLMSDIGITLSEVFIPSPDLGPEPNRPFTLKIKRRPRKPKPT